MQRVGSEFGRGLIDRNRVKLPLHSALIVPHQVKVACVSPYPSGIRESVTEVKIGILLKRQPNTSCQHPSKVLPASAGKARVGDCTAGTSSKITVRIVRVRKPLHVVAQSVVGDPNANAKERAQRATGDELPSRKVVESDHKQL